jgi:hypothetical protein
MALTDFLVRKRAAILERWLQRVFESYPAEMARFLKQVKDPFANPVGATLSGELATLFDGITVGAEPAAIRTSLEALVKLRTVQDFTASQAIGFLLEVKGVVREELGEGALASLPTGEWGNFEAAADGLALAAFDIYASNREKIIEIRLNEMKKRVFVMERASRMFDGGAPDADGGA